MDGDLEIVELMPMIDNLIEQGAVVFLKWSCPSCGERVTANEPNSYHRGGYRHEEKKDGSPCGFLYLGTRFGLLAVHSVGSEAVLERFFQEDR